ncbi:MAG: substrate-binding periplasmic protein [Thermodesulfobacteriota bacterium]
MQKAVWLLILAWLWPAAVLAAPAGELVIACEDFPPYEYLDQGRPAGQDVELVGEACQRLGLVPRFVFTTWTQALADVREGRAMAIMSLSRNPERERFLVFPARPLSRERIIALIRRDSSLRLRGLEDLAGRRVGVNLDYDYGPILTGLPGLIKVEAGSLEGLLRDLAEGRSELALGSELTLEHVARRLKLSHALIRARTLASAPLYIAFSRRLGPRAEELAAGFDQALKAMEEDGAAAIIRGQY